MLTVSRRFDCGIRGGLQSDLWTTELKAPFDPLRDRKNDLCAQGSVSPFGRC